MTSAVRVGHNELLVVAGLMVPLGLLADSLVVSAIGVLLAWIAFSMILPRGGASVAFAVGVLWTNAAVVADKIHGAPAVVGLLPILILAALAAGHIVGHERGVVVSPAFRMLLVHGAALALATLFAINAAEAFTSLQTFVIEGLLLWFVVMNAVHTREGLRLATVALVGGAAFLGLVSVLQFVTKSYGNDFGGFAQLNTTRIELLTSGDASSPKLSGPIGEQNRYAQILLVAVPLAVALSRRWVRWPLMALGAALAMTAGVALTTSRGAAVALALTLPAMAVLRLVSVRALAVAGAAMVVLVLLIPGYQDRLASSITAVRGLDPSSEEEIDLSALSRVAENIAAYNVFVDNPGLGVGPGGFPDQYERYAERVGLNVKEGNRQPHNLYLGIAAEDGVVGLSTFLAVVGIVLWRLMGLWWRARNSEPEIAALAAGFVSAIGGYLLSGVFLHLAFERYYWLMLALADVATRIGTHELERDPADQVVSPDLVPGLV